VRQAYSSQNRRIVEFTEYNKTGTQYDWVNESTTWIALIPVIIRIQFKQQ
jgi:hypothetical protein